jgi:hypothetical protein
VRNRLTDGDGCMTQKERKRKSTSTFLFEIFNYLVCLDFDPGICFPSIYHTSHHDHPQKKKQKLIQASNLILFLTFYRFCCACCCVFLLCLNVKTESLQNFEFLNLLNIYLRQTVRMYSFKVLSFPKSYNQNFRLAT